MAKVCVLIVEDNPDVQELLRTLLEIKGFDVVSAEDGAAALQLLTHVRPDLMLTDMRMPKMDGAELIQCVRRSKEFADLPIIAMSAYGSGRMSEAKAAGATATIRKPTHFDRLVDTINKLLAPPPPKLS